MSLGVLGALPSGLFGFHGDAPNTGGGGSPGGGGEGVAQAPPPAPPPLGHSARPRARTQRDRPEVLGQLGGLEGRCGGHRGDTGM